MNVRNRNRARTVRYCKDALIFILGAVAGRFVDPWEWYRSVIDKPVIVLASTYKSNIGSFRKNILQPADRYTAGSLEITLANQGRRADQDLFVQIELPDTTVIQGVSGVWGMEVHEEDGSWVPVEHQPVNWPEDERAVMIRMTSLAPGLTDTIVVGFYYDKGKNAGTPTVFAYDPDGTYSTTWNSGTGN